MEVLDAVFYWKDTNDLVITTSRGGESVKLPPGLPVGEIADRLRVLADNLKRNAGKRETV